MSQEVLAILVGCAMGATVAIVIIMFILQNVYEQMKAIKRELIFTNRRGDQRAYLDRG
jgi:hypothetical protein